MGKNIAIVILVAVVLGLSVATGVLVSTNNAYNTQLQEELDRTSLLAQMAITHLRNPGKMDDATYAIWGAVEGFRSVEFAELEQAQGIKIRIPGEGRALFYTRLGGFSSYYVGDDKDELKLPFYENGAFHFPQ